MKRTLIGLMIIAMGVMAAQAALGYTLPFYPHYWVTGAAQDASDGTKVDGRSVIFYRTTAESTAGYFAVSQIGPAGASKQAGQYLLNTFSLAMSTLTVGGDYFVAIPNDNLGDPTVGYGASPVAVKITGQGLDLVGSPLVLAKGAGPLVTITPAAPSELAPRIKLWFGSRLYQQALVDKGIPFVVASKPEMKVELAIDPPYTLAKNIDAHSIVVDEGTGAAKTLTLTASNIISQTYAAGTAAEDGRLSSLNLKYTFDEPLADGTHNFSIKAASSGLLAMASVATLSASVEVLGGPLRLVGIPLCYPSPFTIAKHKVVTIQYTLSADANIDMYITGVSGQRIKRYAIMAGVEGGAAGTNKVTWDGRTDQNFLAGNAIYVGTIIAKDEGRLLGKFKLTIAE